MNHNSTSRHSMEDNAGKEDYNQVDCEYFRFFAVMVLPLFSSRGFEGMVFLKKPMSSICKTYFTGYFNPALRTRCWSCSAIG